MTKNKAPRLTKRERKSMDGKERPAPTVKRAGDAEQQHIHCIACGRHLDPYEFEATPPTATVLYCDHKSGFPSCTKCTTLSQSLLAEHDRTGQPVKPAQAWH